MTGTRQQARVMQSSVDALRPWPVSRLQPAFEVWTVRGRDLHDAIPLYRETFDTHDAAVFHGEQSTGHKGHFFVRQVDPISGDATLHFYAVRQESKPRWVKGANGVPQAMRRKYAELLFELAGEDRWPTSLTPERRAELDAEWRK